MESAEALLLGQAERNKLFLLSLLQLHCVTIFQMRVWIQSVSPDPPISCEPDSDQQLSANLFVILSQNI